MKKMTVSVAGPALLIFQPEKARRGIGVKARVRFKPDVFPLQIKASTRGGIPTTNEMAVHGGYKMVECFIDDVTKADPFDALDNLPVGTYKPTEGGKKDWHLLVPCALGDPAGTITFADVLAAGVAAAPLAAAATATEMVAADIGIEEQIEEVIHETDLSEGDAAAIEEVPLEDEETGADETQHEPLEGAAAATETIVGDDPEPIRGSFRSRNEYRTAHKEWKQRHSGAAAAAEHVPTDAEIFEQNLSSAAAE